LKAKKKRYSFLTGDCLGEELMETETTGDGYYFELGSS